MARLVAGVCLLGFVVSVSAQDLAKTAPKQTKTTLDNDRVRVIEITLKPGEKTGMHSHPAHILYMITGGKLKTSFSDGKSTETEFKPGATKWVEPVTHDNENIGTTEIKAIVVELKDKG
jgi:quercetin dioxygenase-like cupin family protein